MQQNHIGLALRAILRLECYCFLNGISRFEAKVSIIREAVRAYLAQTLYTLTARLLYKKEILDEY